MGKKRSVAQKHRRRKDAVAPEWCATPRMEKRWLARRAERHQSAPRLVSAPDIDAPYLADDALPAPVRIFIRRRPRLAERIRRALPSVPTVPDWNAPVAG
ncbi:MAG: hypothetical protein AAF638_00510 [Pseudomonadota bacterium]